MVLRQKAFSFTEAFFKISQKDVDIFLLSMSPLLFKAKCLRIGIINIYDDNINPDLITNFLKWATNRYQNFLQKIVDVHFTRIDFYTTDDNFVSELLKRVGFKYTGKLYREIANINEIDLLSYKLLAGNQ